MYDRSFGAERFRELTRFRLSCRSDARIGQEFGILASSNPATHQHDWSGQFP